MALRDPQPQPLRRRHPLQPHRPAPRRRGPARGLDRRRLRGLGRTELRRLAGARGHVHAARRRAGLRRQGALRRGVRDPPARRHGRALQGRGERDRRQHRPVRRDRRPGVLPRPGGRALRRAQLRRVGGRRGRRRPRLRVHDRRARGRARADRTQLRGRHERRRGLRAGRGRNVPQALQHGHGRLRRARRRPTRSSCARWSKSTCGAPTRRSRRACWSEWERAARQGRVREGDAPRLQARAARAGRGRGAGGARRRQRPAGRAPSRWTRSARRAPDGQARGLPADRAPRHPPAGSGRARARLPRVPAHAAGARSCASRARAAWTAACRSATTAVRWGT